jgi:hypothetical protein
VGDVLLVDGEGLVVLWRRMGVLGRGGGRCPRI